MINIVSWSRRSCVSGRFNGVLETWARLVGYGQREATRSFACVKAMAQSTSKKLLQRQPVSLQQSFDAGDFTSHAQLCALQEKLHAIELREERGSQVRLRCRWVEEEVSSKFSFPRANTPLQADYT